MKYFIDGFEDKKLKAISLICENCDYLYFEVSDIYELLLDNYYQLKSHFNKDSYDNYFDILNIKIKKESIPEEADNNTNPHESFKWKLNLHSICSVTLFFEDGDTVCAYLPYQSTKPKDIEDKKYGYNYLEEYNYEDDYLNINVMRKDTRSKKILDQNKLVEAIKDYFKETYSKVESVILFGDYASGKANNDSVVSLYVVGCSSYKISTELRELLDKDVFVLTESEISIEDKFFKDTITII